MQIDPTTPYGSEEYKQQSMRLLMSAHQSTGVGILAAKLENGSIVPVKSPYSCGVEFLTGYHGVAVTI